MNRHYHKVSEQADSKHREEAEQRRTQPKSAIALWQTKKQSQDSETFSFYSFLHESRPLSSKNFLKMESQYLVAALCVQMYHHSG